MPMQLNNPEPNIWQLNGSITYYNNGMVGVGTNAPSYKFDVVGKINTSSDYLLNGVSILANPKFTGVMTLAGPQIIMYTNYSYNPQMIVTNGSDDGTAGLVLYRKSRGSCASPANVQLYDSSGGFVFQCYYNGSFQNIALFTAQATGFNVGSGLVAGHMMFSVVDVNGNYLNHYFWGDGSLQTYKNIGIGKSPTTTSYLSIAGIPTSPVGLSSGDVWCDTTAGNVLKLV